MSDQSVLREIWLKDSLVTLYFLNYAYLSILAQSQILVISLYVDCSRDPRKRLRKKNYIKVQILREGHNLKKKSSFYFGAIWYLVKYWDISNRIDFPRIS